MVIGDQESADSPIIKIDVKQYSEPVGMLGSLSSNNYRILGNRVIIMSYDAEL